MRNGGNEMRAEDLPVAPRLVTTEEQIQFALDGQEEAIEECRK
jgi:hypothetical protein